MKNSITFIVTFVATITTFSPFAVAEQVMTKDAFSKNCGANHSDYVFKAPKSETQQPQPKADTAQIAR